MKLTRWLLILPMLVVLARASACPSCFLRCRCAHWPTPASVPTRPAPQQSCCSHRTSTGMLEKLTPSGQDDRHGVPCPDCRGCGKWDALPFTAGAQPQALPAQPHLALLPNAQFLPALLAPISPDPLEPRAPPLLNTLHPSIPTTVLRT